MKFNPKTITRRELIKQIGFSAFILHPLLRSMTAKAATSPFAGAPRFIHCFRGASFQPSQMPTAFTAMAGTPLAAFDALKADLILFQNMHTTGGTVQASYQEEHGGGLFGCVTGNTFKHTANDSYYSYTDFESIDIRIAREYQARAALSALPFSSLQLGGGAFADDTSKPPGNNYISFRNRVTGDTTYGNALPAIQDARQVYDMLMARINLICSASSSTPAADTSAMRATLTRKKSVLDLKIKDIMDAKNKFGLDSEHSVKLDGLLQGWRDSEKLVTDQLAALGSSASGGACPTVTRPTAFQGSGEDSKFNLDTLGPLHDQMISMIKLAFQWDLTRVVAFTLGGASSGQTCPSRGVTTYHHALEHGSSSALPQLAKVDAYHAEKFANLMTALKSVDDGGGQTGLSNSSVLFGMECWSSNNTHSLKNIPYILAGQGAGAFQTGRMVDAGGRSNNDLLLSILKASGVSATTFGLASLCKGPIV